jgi:hypothetical protein
LGPHFLHTPHTYYSCNRMELNKIMIISYFYMSVKQTFPLLPSGHARMFTHHFTKNKRLSSFIIFCNFD